MKKKFVRNVLKSAIWLLFIVLGLPLSVSAQTINSGNIIYTIDPVTGTAECTGRASLGQSVIDKFSNLVIVDVVYYNARQYPVTSIAAGAFNNIYDNYKTAFNGTLKIGKNVKKIGGSAFRGQKELYGELLIPNSVTEIGGGAFEGCSGFSGVLTIPNSVTKIGNGAFQDCKGFTGSLTIPNSVTEIGIGAFQDCKGFSGSLTLPDSLTEIEMGAFEGCNGLTGTLTIPNTVTTIGSSAFSGCSGFTGSLIIPNSVTNIVGWAFKSCRGFTGSLTIPNSVTHIGQGAFQYCENLADTLIVGNGIKIIESDTFEGCSFKTIVLPAGLTKCSGWLYFPSYTTVYCAAPTPPDLPLIFTSTPETYKTKLYVPANSIDKYKKAYGWKEFKSFEDITNPSQISLNLASDTVWPGDQVQLEVKVLPDFEFTNKKVEWSSSSHEVQVSDNGLVTARESGSVTISARTQNNLEASAEIKVIGLKLSSEMSILIGKSNTVGAYTYPKLDTMPHLTWTSSDESVASVDSQGTVTGISKGTATIKASVTNHPSVFAECLVTINNPSLLLPSYKELLLGESMVLQVRTDPNIGYVPALTWSSSDSSIVSVNEEGLITAKGLGRATIKVSITDDPDTYTTCQVDVYYKGSEISFSFGEIPGTVIIKSIPDQNCYIIPAQINVPTNEGEKIYTVQKVWLESMPEKLQKVAYPAGIETNLSKNVIAIPYNARNCIINSNSIVDTQTNSLVFVEMAASGAFEIPTDIAAVDAHAFDLCYEISAISIADSDQLLTFKESRDSNPAFSTISPTTIHVGRNITYQVSPFRENCSISNITFGSGITEIGDYMFFGCSGIMEVTIPESVIQIGKEAFSKCSGIRELNVPESVIQIGEEAFSKCSGLSQLLFQDCTNDIKLDKNVFSDTPVDYLYYGRKVLNNNGGVFSNWPKTIKTIETGRYIESLSDYVFYGIPNLYSITIGIGTRSISDKAFEGSEITKVIWMPNTPPQGYNSIAATINYVSTDKYEFERGQIVIIPNLSSKFYSNGLIYVFSREAKERTCAVIDNRYNRYITKLDVPHILRYQDIDFIVEEISDYAFYCNKYYQTASIGDGITRIGKYSLFNCSTINANPYIGKAVKIIDDYAFNSCTSIPAMVIPDATEYLGKWSLSNCTELNNILLGKRLMSIESGCFANDVSLTQIVIPKNVMKIGNQVFDACKSLEYLEIRDRIATLSMGYSRHSDTYDPSYGTMGDLTSAGIPLFNDCPLKEVYIGGDISYSISPADGYSPFYRNDAIQKVVINNNETEISDNEFYGCRGLKNVIIGNDVTRIGNYAFSGCMSLEYFTLGKLVKTIGVEAFSDCDKMVEIKSYNNVPPTCGDQALDDINKFNCTLFVPESAVSVYADAPQWENFFYIKRIDDKSILADWLTVDPSTWSGEENTQFRITATVLPVDTSSQKLVWSSSDETIASVSQNGLVTVHKEGTCIIIVKTTDGSDLSAECLITSRSGINDVLAENAVYDIYNMSGILIMSQATNEDMKDLDAGIYVLRSGKLTKKIVLR